MVLLQQLLLFVFITVIYPVVGRSCTDYVHLAPNRMHVMCANPIPNCRVTKAGITKDDQERILHALNSYRDEIARGKFPPLPPAANMKQVVWDDELAALAQRQAELCNELASCPECRATDRFPVGQFVFKSNKEKLNWKDLVHRWFEKTRHIPLNDIDIYDPLQVNNSYAEIAWADMENIGCGFSMHHDKDAGRQFRLYICNYGPGVLKPGKSIYTIGKPCYMQSKNSCCPNYSALVCSSKVPRRKTREIDANLANISEVLPNWSELPTSPELLSCTFNRRDCRIKSIGTHPWMLKNNTQDEYYEVVVRRGGNAVLFILNGIPPSSTGNACLTFKYRKTTKGLHPLSLKVFSWSLMGPPIEIFIRNDTSQWTEWKTQISDLKGYAIIFFHVSVPDEAAYSALRVAVDDIKILESNCS